MASTLINLRAFCGVYHSQPVIADCIQNSLFLETQVRESAKRNGPWSWVLIASCAQ